MAGLCRCIMGIMVPVSAHKPLHWGSGGGKTLAKTLAWPRPPPGHSPHLRHHCQPRQPGQHSLTGAAGPSVSTNGSPAVAGEAWPRGPLIGWVSACEAVTLSVLLWRYPVYPQCRDPSAKMLPSTHRWDRTLHWHWEDTCRLKPDLETIT